jgi:hypothetical protein
MMTNTMTPAERFENARKRIQDGDARNLSESTMRKRWRDYFAAEDALKSSAGAWA